MPTIILSKTIHCCSMQYTWLCLWITMPPELGLFGCYVTCTDWAVLGQYTIVSMTTGLTLPLPLPLILHVRIDDERCDAA